MNVQFLYSCLAIWNKARGGGVFSEDDIRETFINTYIDDFEAFNKRFNEQIVSGNIYFDEINGGYKLTSSGKTVVKLFRIVAKVFDTDERLVYPLGKEDK